MADLLTPHRDASWDLPGLVAAARSLLDRVGSPPDERTVRYYQTGGLVDRPARYEGRTALYGYRHLLQVLAIKLLQAEGHTLAQVQQALAGVPTAGLEEAVRTSLGVPAPAEAPVAAPRSLIAAEVAPGVTVLVDPAVVSDPGALVDRIAKALSPSGGPR